MYASITENKPFLSPASVSHLGAISLPTLYTRSFSFIPSIPHLPHVLLLCTVLVLLSEARLVLPTIPHCIILYPSSLFSMPSRALPHSTFV